MRLLTTIVYKPIGIVMGIVAGLLGRRVFDFVWGKIDEEDPPEANTREAPLGKLVAAAALQGAIFTVVRTAVERQTARGFHYLTGAWPGPDRPEPE